MSGPILLPAPVSSSAILLGQLLVDPLNPEYNSFDSYPDPLALNEPLTQRDYKDLVTHDDEGRLVSSLSGRTYFPRESIALLQADQNSYTSLKSPTAAFDALRRQPASQDYFRKVAPRTQTLYYVTGVQKLKNPTFKKAPVDEDPRAILPASSPTKIRLPLHERRDSILDVQETSNDAVFGVELRKVKCRVGPPDEPHSMADIGYAWTYHKVDGQDDVQLAIGLGKRLEAAEFRALAGIVSLEDFSDGAYDSDTDDDGLAGF